MWGDALAHHCLQLEDQSYLPQDRHKEIGAIKAVYTVDSSNTVLEGDAVLGEEADSSLQDEIIGQLVSLSLELLEAEWVE